MANQRRKSGVHEGRSLVLLSRQHYIHVIPFERKGEQGLVRVMMRKEEGDDDDDDEDNDDNNDDDDDNDDEEGRKRGG